jgi:hypothetical protein
MKIKEMKMLFNVCVDLISNYLIKEILLSPNGKIKYNNNIPIKPCISKKNQDEGIKIPCTKKSFGDTCNNQINYWCCFLNTLKNDCAIYINLGNKNITHAK